MFEKESLILAPKLKKFTIIAIGNKQHIVREGIFVILDFLKHVVPNDYVYFLKNLVLLNNDILIVGKPFISNIKTGGFVLKHVKNKKVFIFRFKKKKNYSRSFSFRPFGTIVFINKILNYGT